MAKYTESEAKQFIEHIAPMIVNEGTKRGYKVFSTTIAQAIIEGACGKSTLARDYHNHFGMKTGKSWRQAGKPYAHLKTKEEYQKGVLVEIYADFRSYVDDLAGVAGYYDFISASRYANLKTARTYEEYAQFLKKDAWATSSVYVDTLCKTVRKYSLFVYDKEFKVEYFPRIVGQNSIVEALDSLGVDSSRAYRKKIYQMNFTDEYKYTAVQNMKLLSLLEQGRLIKP